MLTLAHSTQRVIHDHWWSRDCPDPWTEWVIGAVGQVWEWAYYDANLSQPGAWELVLVIAVHDDAVKVRSVTRHQATEVWMSLDALIEMARPTWVPWPHPDSG